MTKQIHMKVLLGKATTQIQDLWYVKILSGYIRLPRAFELRIYHVAQGWKKRWADTPSVGPETRPHCRPRCE